MAEHLGTHTLLPPSHPFTLFQPDSTQAKAPPAPSLGQDIQLPRVSFWEVPGSWNKRRLRASASRLGGTLMTSDLAPPPTYLGGMRSPGPQIGHFLVAPTGILDTSGLGGGGWL